MLEYAVRPYQTPNSQGKIIIPSTPGSTSARATITWGSQNSASIPKANTGVNVQCCKEELTELQRQGENVQIPISQTQQDQGYLEVFRSNKLTLNKKANNNACDSPLDQYLGAEFGLDDTGDTRIDLGWAGTPDQDSQCGQTWNLNNNTAGG